jgi:hypothetical protein
MLAFVGLGLLLAVGCQDSEEKKKSSKGKSYSFTSDANVSIELASRSHRLSTSGPTLCSSVVCFTPTALTGRFFGTGFLIQSKGNGMVAYFGQDSWSGITGSSETYDFSSATPVTHPGTLTCCNGTGNLDSSSSYIESAIYLFSYLDATFTVSGVTGNTSMNREFTVRFLMADDAVTSGKRGDLLLKDPDDGVFKWMDTSTSAGGNVGAGTLTTTRPASPVTMDEAVTDWTNPFGSGQGNQEIPVIYAPVLPESGSGVVSITESGLSVDGQSYTYGFDPTNFVMFPTMIKTSDINMLYSYKELLAKIHLGGLPHSQQSKGVGSPASTILTIASP